ncbi:unnamed protein product [Cladocopium goreaui]|uniref:Uncharacterized protein n=1 Tax=Cladocopium goreaui TaxID=2562237 RepID=A0A9P1BVI3_9DINO|nr:unnamed protein product [Cladocopium goreaui]
MALIQAGSGDDASESQPQQEYTDEDFASRGGKRDALATSTWLRKLQTDNPTEYKKVFKEFKNNVPDEKGGRSKKRVGWKPQQLVVCKSHEATKQSRWAGNYEEMRFGRYLQYFTGDECDPEDRMTDSEARINWMKETKHKIKVYSHKKQKHEVVEVVSVEVKRTRHQEQIGAEKSTATQVTEQVNNEPSLKWMGKFMNEDTAIDGEGDGGNGKRKKAKKPTKKKETDIATAKLRSATKVVNQRKLLAALFKDTEEKLQAWYGQHKAMVDKTKELIEKGVSEERLLTDNEVFGLDDNASVVKMIYTILARHELLELLSYGMHPTPAETTPTPADKTEMTLDELSKKIEEKINKDPFMTEQAPSVISLKELADPEGMFSGCSMAADIQDIEASMMKRIANSKTAVAALRRTMKDCDQMVKSVQKARQRYQDQLARSTQTGKGTNGPNLSGRPNLNNLDKDDPEVLRAYKQISQLFEMRVVTNLEEDDKDKQRFPVIIRKGRNSLSMMCGHKEPTKKFFTTCNTSFVNQLQTQSLTRPTSAVKTCDSSGCEDPVAAAAVLEMKTRLFDLLPPDWKKETCFVDEETLEVHAKKNDLEQGMTELSALHLCGAKQGVTYCGIENCALPSLRLQVSGSKMVVMASVAEIMEHFGVNGLAEARDRFQSLAAADLPDPASGFSSGLQGQTVTHVVDGHTYIRGRTTQ